MRPASFQRIPPITVRTAWAACPKGTPVMLMRDRLDVVFADEDFADLYPADGRPAFSPGQLALVSVLQFAENLSDRAAADAVRTRIDWKYGLGLELDDPGFDYSVLRVPGPAGRGRPGGSAAAVDAGPPGGGRTAQGAGPTAYRRHPCPGSGAPVEPAGAGGRERAGRPGGDRRDGSGLAGAADRARVGHAIRPESRDRESPGRQSSGARTRRGVRPGRPEASHRGLGGRHPSPSANVAAGGDPSAGLDPPALLGSRGAIALAGGHCPAAGLAAVRLPV
ncbi:transposase [Streptomyces sp. SAS_276]|uniref:transposase n=1 Tax=Streptomyces sp. SAS_276 TaxID=3412745 RepID=UPI00403D4A30